MDILSRVLSVFMIVVYIIFLQYLFKLERIGCECAMDWRRHYIIFFFILNVIVMSFTLTMGPYATYPVQLVLSLLNILNIVFMVQYTHRLKVEKCECSASQTREIMYYYSIISAVILVLVFIIAILKVANLYAMMSTRTAKSPKKYFSVRKLKK